MANGKCHVSCAENHRICRKILVINVTDFYDKFVYFQRRPLNDKDMQKMKKDSEDEESDDPLDVNISDILNKKLDEIQNISTEELFNVLI
ncbi:unnamed protein product, partial [Brenthis ino]